MGWYTLLAALASGRSPTPPWQIDDLVRIGFVHHELEHVRPLCLEEGWHGLLAVGPCIWPGGGGDGPSSHWLLPESSQGRLRLSKSPHLCLHVAPWPVLERGSVQIDVGEGNFAFYLTMRECSGHANQSFLLSPGSQSGSICWSARPDMCLGINEVCAPPEARGVPMMATLGTMLACSKYNNTSVVFPFGTDEWRAAKFISVATVAAAFIAIPLLLIAYAGALLWAGAKTCRKGGKARAQEMLSSMWWWLSRSCCLRQERSAADTKLQALLHQFRIQRLSWVIATTIHLLAVALLMKLMQFSSLLTDGVHLNFSGGSVDFGIVIEATSRSDFFLCFGVFALFLPLWLRPRWMSLHVIPVLFCSFTLIAVFNIWIFPDLPGFDKKLAQLLLRVASPVVFGSPWLSAFLNITVAAAEIYWTPSDGLETGRLLTREGLLTVLVVVIAWALDASMRSTAKSHLQAQEARNGKRAVSCLLNGYCDTVIQLSQDFRISDAGKLHGLLLMASSDRCRGRPFTDLVEPMDVRRFEDHMLACQASAQKPEDHPSLAISIDLLDVNRTRTSVELHCCCLMDVHDDTMYYMLGIKETSEAHLAPSSLGEDATLPLFAAASVGFARESSPSSSVTDSHPPSDGPENSRTATFQADTFEIQQTSVGFDHLMAGAPSGNKYIVDYLETPGRFMSEIRSIVHDVAEGDGDFDGSHRLKEPYLFRFPRHQRQIKAELEISVVGEEDEQLFVVMQMVCLRHRRSRATRKPSRGLSREGFPRSREGSRSLQEAQHSGPELEVGPSARSSDLPECLSARASLRGRTRPQVMSL